MHRAQRIVSPVRILSASRKKKNNVFTNSRIFPRTRPEIVDLSPFGTPFHYSYLFLFSPHGTIHPGRCLPRGTQFIIIVVIKNPRLDEWLLLLLKRRCWNIRGTRIIGTVYFDRKKADSPGSTHHTRDHVLSLWYTDMRLPWVSMFR